MRVMVFAKTAAGVGEAMASPTPEMVEAFRAMDEFTEELVKAGVFVAAAGLKNGAESKRIVSRKGERKVIDGPFAESRELVAGFSIWEVKDMDEAMTWAMRAPNGLDGEVEIRPFYEVDDLAEFVTPGELAGSREGDRGRLGVA